MVGIQYIFIEVEQQNEMLKAECVYKRPPPTTRHLTLILFFCYFYSVNTDSATSRLCTVLYRITRELKLERGEGTGEGTNEYVMIG